METSKIEEKLAIESMLGYLASDHNIQIDYWYETFPDFAEKIQPYLDIAAQFGAPLKIEWLLRWSPSGRVRIFDSYTSIYHFLFGMITLLYEQTNTTPFLSEHDGNVIIDESDDFICKILDLSEIPIFL